MIIDRNIKNKRIIKKIDHGDTGIWKIWGIDKKKRSYIFFSDDGNIWNEIFDIII